MLRVYKVLLVFPAQREHKVLLERVYRVLRGHRVLLVFPAQRAHKVLLVLVYRV